MKVINVTIVSLILVTLITGFLLIISFRDPDWCSNSQLKNPHNPTGHKCISRGCHRDYKKCTRSECIKDKYGHSLMFDAHGQCIYSLSVDSNISPT